MRDAKSFEFSERVFGWRENAEKALVCVGFEFGWEFGGNVGGFYSVGIVGITRGRATLAIRAVWNKPMRESDDELIERLEI